MKIYLPQFPAFALLYHVISITAGIFGCAYDLN
jgi:hypothetical protein